MCFKKPKPIPKSAEDIALEEELKAARANRKREVADELKLEKEQRTEAAIARALGLFGGRSLIAGPKGGAGFLGFGAGRVTGRGATSARAGSSPGSGGLGGYAPAASPTYSAPKGGSGGGSGGGRDFGSSYSVNLN